MPRETGFSLVEAVVATALVLALTAAVCAWLDPARSVFVVQTETAEMQQRLRVAVDTLSKDLTMAGAGADAIPNGSPLTYFFPPVLPYRTDAKHADPPGTFRTDAISVMYVSPMAAQTTLALAGPGAGVGSVIVNNQPGCPVSAPACGFQPGTTALIADGTGLHDTFLVSSVVGNLLGLQSASSSLGYAFYPGQAPIVEVTYAAYSMVADPSTGAFQLVRFDGGAGADIPVVDHLVSLRFDYYGDPRPPALTGIPLSDPVGPWTTYGPPPPAVGTQGPTHAYPPGESCLFAVDPLTGTQASRLAPLPVSGPGTLAKLSAADLTDGPWCPDPGNVNRWDADLLRVRSIVVTLRFQAANAALRGPASLLFANGGTATGVNRWLPDIETTIQVTPRNLAPER